MGSFNPHPARKPGATGRFSLLRYGVIPDLVSCDTSFNAFVLIGIQCGSATLMPIIDGYGINVAILTQPGGRVQLFQSSPSFDGRNFQADCNIPDYVPIGFAIACLSPQPPTPQP